MMKRNNETFGLRNVLPMLAIIIFFVGVILIYHAMLYTETNERIAVRCELSAVTSAERIDEYLSMGLDTIKLACYSLDNMIRDHRSKEEMLDFLKTQSAAVASIAAVYSTGVYACINGELLDGNGWIPDADYIPAERPWYIDAHANIGKVAVVDPYLDVMTGNIMITLSKTLCDAKSVAAIDISMEPLQSITEEMAERDVTEMEIVLSRKYQVIAHSDRAEIGRNYFSESGTFGAALVEKLRATDEGSFSLRFGGAEYVVYTVPVADNWLYLSVFNATSVFRQLRSALLFTIAASFLFTAILLGIMFNSDRKSRIARELAENLSQARNDILEKDSQIGEISEAAFRDPLTAVGSKAAFVRFSEEISGELASGGVELAVVMADVNNLKYINDNFGHDAGDRYIQGCCHLICDIYRHSPVFRVGGDEFVVVLRGGDYEHREKLSELQKKFFQQAWERTDKEPWERYSASVGMACALPGDTSLDQILKRADSAMYEVKKAFKAEHGSYR